MRETFVFLMVLTVLLGVFFGPVMLGLAVLGLISYPAIGRNRVKPNSTGIITWFDPANSNNQSPRSSK